MVLSNRVTNYSLYMDLISSMACSDWKSMEVYMNETELDAIFLHQFLRNRMAELFFVHGLDFAQDLFKNGLC